MIAVKLLRTLTAITVAMSVAFEPAVTTPQPALGDSLVPLYKTLDTVIYNCHEIRGTRPSASRSSPTSPGSAGGRSGSTSRAVWSSVRTGPRAGAYYTRRHLQRLLDIVAWQSEGLTLEGVRQRLDAPPEQPPARARSAVEVWTRLTLADGVELHVNAESAGLRPEDTRRLAAGVKDLLGSLQTGGQTDE